MSLHDKIKYNDQGLIPTIILDAADGKLLTLCYLNRDAVDKTLETGFVHVFRRSKGRLMLKGESSGHTQEVKEVFIDCEGNSLALKVEQKVAGCHAGYRSCYFQRYNPTQDELEVVEERVFDPDAVYSEGKNR